MTTKAGELDFPQLEAYYMNRLLLLAASVLPGRTLVVYQEVRSRLNPGPGHCSPGYHEY